MAGYVQLVVEDERPLEAKEILATLGWVEKLPSQSNLWTEREEIDIPESRFSMLKSVEIRHPELSGKTIQLHPPGEHKEVGAKVSSLVGAPGEHDLEVSLQLEKEDQILGFQVKEVKNPDSGASEFYNPQVLIRDPKAVRLEPLSQHFFHPAPVFPGKVRWLPATAQPRPDGQVKGSEVIGLRAMPGLQHDHLVGVVQKFSFWSFDVQSLTGQSAMFWFDLLLLVLVLFYADIILDIKQLKLFGDQGLFDYLAFNTFGLLIPPVVTMWDALHWLERPSPERDHFAQLFKSDLMQKMVLTLVVVSQTHVLLLVLLSIRFRKHPLLQGAKNAEVAESAISALVQTNFLVCYVAGVTAIAELELPMSKLQSMALSVLISCFSSGLSFAGRDKKDSSVLGLPGKIGWGPTMMCLVLVRSLETGSRMAAFNVIQVTLRGGWYGHLAGPMAILLYVLAARLCFPEAEVADILASVVAHPGQILEPQSLLPLWRSLMLHGLLAMVAGLPQLLLRSEYRTWMPSDSKEIPTIYMLGWSIVTACSFVGLICLYCVGRNLKQPLFDQLREDDGTVLLSSFISAFNSKHGQVSKSASAAFDDVVKVDTVIDQKTLAELVTSQCPVSFSYATYDHLVHLYAHSDDSDLEPGHIEVMNQLGHCNLVTLDLKFNTFFGPPPIPAAAWQKLQGGWPNLKVARFDGCFVQNSPGLEGAAALLQALSFSRKLEELSFQSGTHIPATAWQKLRDAQWPNLKVAKFVQCFGKESPGADGAVDLLEALSRSQALEELVLDSCPRVPTAAWQKLQGVQWSNLKVAKFSVCFVEDSPGLDGAVALLEALSWSPTLETLDLFMCTGIPAAAWQKLRVARWSNLKVAKCFGCFGQNGPGVDAAVVVLEALSRSPTLETLDFSACPQAAAAWPLVPDGTWPKLKPYGVPQEELPRLHGDVPVGGEVANSEEAPADATLTTAMAGAKYLKVVRAESLEIQEATKLLVGLSFSQTLETVNFSKCLMIPPAVWRMLPAAQWANLKVASFSQCFNSESKGVDFAEDLLEALSRSQTLEEMDFLGCRQIPACAWQKLRDARWANLKVAKVDTCFVEDSPGLDGAVALLEALSWSPTLETLGFFGCSHIPAAAWQKLQAARWPKLKAARFGGCFGKESPGVDGAVDLLEALSRSQTLEELVLNGCSRIPAAAWQKLQGVQWTNLKTVKFDQCFGVHSQGLDFAVDLLEVLRQATTLEVCYFDHCSHIPLDAWQKLRGARWSNLRVARFMECFCEFSPGIDGAVDLLGALSFSRKLEELYLQQCQIAAVAWQQVPPGAWPKLKNGYGVPAEELLRIKEDQKMHGC